MAQLNKDTIKTLAELSRIACSEEEMDSLFKDLEKIVTYVEQLQEIDTENTPPCNHVLETGVNVLREDLVDDILPREIFLANAPEQVSGLIKVPPIIKKH